MAEVPFRARAERFRFRFCPRPQRLDADERERFAARLRAALRVARGLGSGFSLEWRTGPAGGIALECSDARARIWSGGVLFGAYAPDQWRPDTSDPAEPARAVAAGLAAAAPDLPFPTAAGGVAWSDGVFRALARLEPGAAAWWRVRPAPIPRRPVSLGPRPLEPAAASPLQRRAPPSAVERAVRDAGEARRLAPAWSVVLRLTVIAPGGERPAGDLARILESAAQFDGGNALRFRKVRPWDGDEGPRIWLSESEALTLWPSPASEAALPAEASHSVLRLPIGRRSEGGPASIEFEPDQGRHAAVIGETGMGKSSCLIRLGWAARRFGGVILLDPIGETARGFLAGLPERERTRVLWIAAHDAPVGVNALAALSREPSPSGVERERAIADLVQALRRVRSARYPERSFWGPRLEEMLGQALALAGRVPGGTLGDAYRLLEEARPPDRVTDAGLRREMAALGRRLRERPDDAEGARRLLGEIVRSGTLRRLLCDGGARIRIADAVGADRIFVLSGDASRVGELAARYLLSVWLALLWSELLTRTPPSKTTVLLDESHWYAHDALAEMLRLGRSRNTHAVVATQTLGSLPEDVREAVLANAADFVLFRGSPDDAREFGRWTDPRLPERLLALPRGHAILLRGKGAAVDPIVTAPLVRNIAGQIRATEWARDVQSGVGDDATGISEAREAASSTDNAPAVPAHAPGGVPKPENAAPSTPARAEDWASLRACSEPAMRSPDEADFSGRPATVRVSLAVLRHRLGESASADIAIRHLGARLGRSGALVGRGRDARGAFWELDPARLDAAQQAANDPPSSPSGGSDAPSRRDEN